jgi:chromosome segregation ATPase
MTAEELEDKITKASSIIEALERENDQLKSTIRDLEERGDEVGRDTNRLKQKIIDLESQVHAKEQELQSLRSQLANIPSSPKYNQEYSGKNYTKTLSSGGITSE